ncbi:Cof-type HAD-IIB family hydrolase [Coriobacterium glomerans]|nr:Cof-type HAD-IIB family hydrolase [Coriobacterium glomerans]
METVIFADIDGTLLNSEHQITTLTRQAIDTVQNNGIPFVIVTARGITGTYPLLDQNGIRCPVITYSGGVILDEHRNVIYHDGLTRDRAADVVDFIESNNLDMVWCAFSFEDWISQDRSDPRILNEESIVMARSREGAIASVERDEVQKILCICNPAETNEIERRLGEHFSDLMIVKSSDILIEVMPMGTTKAAAIRRLCALWNLPIELSIAFGDSYNDVPMLEAAGKGYLMANAPVDLKCRLPLLTDRDNDHDGIYWTLKDLDLV